MSRVLDASLSTSAPVGHGRTIAALAGLAMLLLIAAAARLMIGEGFGWPDSAEVLDIRLDRLLIGASVGAALGVAGAILQALLRNPLASPYVVGVSTGATVGLMANWAGWLAVFGAVSDHISALGGALACMAIVYALGQRRGRVEPLTLLLVGVMVNAINNAILMFIQYLTPHGRRGDIALWMLGYLNDSVTRQTILITCGATALGIAATVGLGRAMDVASFSDAEAHSIGVNLRRLRLWLFLLAGWLTAAAVVLAGPIGFVGLIAPHAVRLLIGPAHRPLIIGAAITGAALVVGADVAIKLVAITWMDAGGGLMPIGVITALIGGPVFLFMLRSELSRRSEP